MTDEVVTAEAPDERAQGESGRRDFFRALGAAAAVGGALSVAHRPAAAQVAGADADFVNLALNLEYLEAQFFNYAAFGTGLPNSLLGGKGKRGEARGGRAVNFSDPILARYVREIAQDERNHVEFLRLSIDAASRVAQPNIDISRRPDGAFSTAARGAGLIGENEAFDPYASDENFLLAAFFLEDLVVTAYAGLAPRVGSRPPVDLLAGLAAAEGHHAGIIRAAIYRKSVGRPELRQATIALSNYRDSLDGPEEQDQGVFRREDVSNVAPLDEKGRAHRRTPGEVLNVVYLNAGAVRRGGFFPNGLNGAIFQSENQNEAD